MEVFNHVEGLCRFTWCTQKPEFCLFLGPPTEKHPGDRLASSPQRQQKRAMKEAAPPPSGSRRSTHPAEATSSHCTVQMVYGGAQQRCYRSGYRCTHLRSNNNHREQTQQQLQQLLQQTKRQKSGGGELGFCFFTCMQEGQLCGKPTLDAFHSDCMHAAEAISRAISTNQQQGSTQQHAVTRNSSSSSKLWQQAMAATSSKRQQQAAASSRQQEATGP
ncbi:hypothetical protein ACSSS7_007219 [Eimeria intestinalis]